MSRRERDRKRQERARARLARQKDAPQEGEGGRRRGEGMELVRSVLIAVVLFVVIRTFLVQTFVITSGSMEDTLLVGDFLMVNRAAMGSRIPATTIRVPGYSEPERGDVLVFDPTHEDDMKLVKRLIGMPGDTLHMEDKLLFINGVPQQEPYVKHLDSEGDHSHPWMTWQRPYLLDGADPAEYAPTRDTWGPIAIPEGYFFMLGDNRDYSLDSRYWGLIEEWRVEGRASFFYFSYDRASPRAFSFLREIRWGRIGDRIR
jgi:signal peptidase I